jgi:branched-chain amino acid transport system substrate-binding protein
MTKTTKIIIGAVVAIIVIGGIWYGLTQKPQEAGTIKIGVLGDLTGDYASLLRGAVEGVQVAVDDLQNTTNRKIELIIEDQKSCDVKETVTIMNKLVNVDKVDMIVGGTCSSTTIAAAPIAESSKTVMISPVSSAPSITTAGDYIFRTYVTDTQRAQEGANLAYELGYRNAAIITNNTNEAFVQVNEIAKDQFLSLGGSVVLEEKTNSTTDFRTQIAKVKDQSPDVIILAFGPNTIGLFAKQMLEAGLKTQIIVPLETPEDKQVIETGGSAVDGIIYVMPGNPPQSEQYLSFEDKYKEKFNSDDVPQYAAEAYDATILGVRAILASDGTKEDIKNKLYEVSKTYEGVSGNVTFDANGDVQKNVLIKTIQDGQFVEYKK